MHDRLDALVLKAPAGGGALQAGGVQLVAIAWIRKVFLKVALRVSLVQVTLGGFVVAAVGVLVGHA